MPRVMCGAKREDGALGTRRLTERKVLERKKTMKKLIMAVAIVCAAVMAQAATVQWKSGTVYTATEGTGAWTSTKLTSGTASLYALTADEYTTFLAAITADYATGAKSIYDAYNGTTALATASVNKGAFTLTDTRDNSTATAAAPIDFYSAIIYTYTDGNGADWFIANVGTQHFEANVAGTASYMATKIAGDSTGTSIAGWQPVPEPTSGLLLLLGMAGLALRRRRA